MKAKIDLHSDISTRAAMSEAITEIGLKDDRVVTVAVDSESRFGDFVQKAPERALNVGIAEQNAMSMSAGLAFSGKIPFVSTYATFMSMRACEQIRTDIAFANLNVRIVGTNSGLSSEWLGFTHQCLEDVGLMRSIPNMTVVTPADGEQTYQFIEELIDYQGPVYLKIRSKGDEPHIAGKGELEIGTAQTIKQGSDLTVIACGRMVSKAVEAAEKLAKEGIETRVLNMHTIKPIDENAVVKAAEETKAIITIEEHNVYGGLGSAVAEVLSEKKPAILGRMGIKDDFGVPGLEEDLFRHFNLTADDIVQKASQLLS